jgi:deoxyribodipyrimidine photo-lyase
MSLTTSPPVSVVWFKRDLRLSDHAPLAAAAARGRVVCLYVVEPMLLQQPETDASHYQFIAQCLAELRDGLAQRGARLLIRRGEVTQVLSALQRAIPFDALLSHEETGNALTYARDKQVKRWCAEAGVQWTELPQTGVIRPGGRRHSAQSWASQFITRLNTAPLPPPAAVDDGVAGSALADVDIGDGDGPLPFPQDVGLGHSTKPNAQRGGEREARLTMKSFLRERGGNYATEMSSPTTAWRSCSRISPHLAYGSLSMRQAFVSATRRRQALEGSPTAAHFRRSLEAFTSRLFWHCHFMQKLEDETSIEFDNLSSSVTGLREQSPFNEHHFQSWCRGETGFPLIDACMRQLLETGWLNFRMRAMLVSFSSYHLWLPWRRPALHLAKHFLDFEPGIHFPQVQMQSGTTGTNTLRIYNPTKQAKDQDPRGSFIRRMVPELRAVDDDYIHTPHLMPPLLQRSCGVVIGRDYPAPIVDEVAAMRRARAALTAVRRTTAARAEARNIAERHGSRRPPLRPSAARVGGDGGGGGSRHRQAPLPFLSPERDDDVADDVTDDAADDAADDTGDLRDVDEASRA